MNIINMIRFLHPAPFQRLQLQTGSDRTAPSTPTLALPVLPLFLLGSIPVCLDCVEDLLQLLLSQRHHVALQRHISAALTATLCLVFRCPITSQRGSTGCVLVSFCFGLFPGIQDQDDVFNLELLLCVAPPSPQRDDRKTTARRRNSHLGWFLATSSFMCQSAAPANAAGCQKGNFFPCFVPCVSLPSQW